MSVMAAQFLYFWGESLCHNVLGKQSLEITPWKTARALFNNLPAHTNVPATSPSVLDSIHQMTTRIVQRWNNPPSGVCPQYFNIVERIVPLDALKAFTIDAARLYQLDEIKGSLVVGKLADMT